MVPETLSYICPFCDSVVRVGKVCPGCAKESKNPQPKNPAWRQDSSSDGLDLPDEDFDYDEFVAREFGQAPHRALGQKWYWWVLGIVVLGGMVVSVFWL